MNSKSPVTIFQLESQAYSGDYAAALQTLFDMLGKMDRVGASNRLVSASGHRRDQLNLYTRIAAAFTAIVSDPKFSFNVQNYQAMMLHKRTLTAIFRVSSFGTMDHIIALASNSASRDGYASGHTIWKGILCATSESPSLNAEAIIGQLPPVDKVVFWLSLLDRDYHLTEVDEDRRRKVLKLAPLIEEIDVSIPSLSVLRLSNVWMTTSYFNDPNKHDLKITLNKLVKGSLLAEGVKEPVLPSKRKVLERPKMAVLSEWFTRGHSMYRCYGPAIKTLSERFEMVLVTSRGTVDEEGKSLFDEVVSFPLATRFSEVIKKISALNADIIYYPSIGMQAWTLAACQLRLAPIQAMTIGHPATTKSEFIDYVLIPERYVGDPDCFSETIIALENDAFPFVPPTTIAEVQLEKNQTASDKIRIAVPSNGYKLNPEFLDCCRQVSEKSDKPVEFHIFPNLPEHLALELEIHCESLFPSVVHMGTSYAAYMNLVGQCDIQISPFPFGNTNGYIDGLLLGLPIVSMDGKEAHSRIDNALGEMAGMPEFCLTKTPEEYVDAILRLVDNDEERESLSLQIADTDVGHIFFGHESNKSFLEAFSWVYDHHESISSKDKKLWSLESRTEVL